MKSDHPALAKVQKLLLKISSNLQKADENTFTLRHESARAFIRVDEEDANSFVTIEILMVKDLTLTPELLEFVALDNSYTFGHIYLEPLDGSAVLMFRHTLLADNLDETLRRQALPRGLSPGHVFRHSRPAQRPPPTGAV